MRSAIRTALFLCCIVCLGSIYSYNSHLSTYLNVRPASTAGAAQRQAPEGGHLAVPDANPHIDQRGAKKDGNHRSVTLMTSYYHEPVEARRLELFETVVANLRNPHIDTVCLLLEVHQDQEQPALPTHDKLRTIVMSEQPLYSQIINHANTQFSDHIVILQNTDIEWDNTTTGKLQALAPGTVFALSRHPHPRARTEPKCSERQQCEDYNGSHDAFAFISPLPQSLMKELQFRQNLWGAENRVIYELKAAGLVVLNPCKSIITTHYHCSRKRSTPQQRINREKGDRYGAFYKSGFVASAKLYAITDQRLQCQQIQDDSYGIPFVDKDPRAMLGKSMTKWQSNAQLHVLNNEQWSLKECEKHFMVPEVSPSEKEAGWRSPKQMQRLTNLQSHLHLALFSHTANKTFRESLLRTIARA